MMIEWDEDDRGATHWKLAVWLAKSGLYIMEWRNKPGEWWVTRSYMDPEDNLSGPYTDMDAAKAAYLMILGGE